MSLRRALDKVCDEDVLRLELHPGDTKRKHLRERERFSTMANGLSVTPSRKLSRRGVFAMATISSPDPFNSSSSSFSLLRNEEPSEEEESLLKFDEDALENGENLLTRSEEVVELAGPDVKVDKFSWLSGPRIGEIFRGWIPSNPKLQSPESSEAAGLGIPVNRI